MTLTALNILTLALAQPMTPVEVAIWQVESSKRLNPPDGDQGRAIGPMQIWLPYWQDARMPKGTYQDCRRLAYAVEVTRRYAKRYKAVTDKQRALAHHYGPNWRKIKDRHGYWAKVQKAMKE